MSVSVEGDRSEPSGGPLVRLYPCLAFGNFRNFLGGQSLSLAGNWMQQTVQMWMMLTITHSGTMVGLAAAAQTLPTLLFSPHAGLYIDRRNKRQVLIGTQILLAGIALVFGVLITSHVINRWWILGLCLATGLAGTIDNPARQAFAIEMVDEKSLKSALSLASATANVARMVGPAIAGLLIAAHYESAICYFNAVTSAAVIAALAFMNQRELHAPRALERGGSQVKDAFVYVWRTPEIFAVLAMMTLIGTFTYNFQTVLPMIAHDTFHADARLFGFLYAAAGLGAVVGALIAGMTRASGVRTVSLWAGGLGLTMALASVAPTVATMLFALFAAGVCECSFYASGSSWIQLSSASQYRARVASLWGLAFRGSTPIGGPIAGAVCMYLSPRFALGMGALAACIAAVCGLALSIRPAPGLGRGPAVGLGSNFEPRPIEAARDA